jgi:hypothetical protein
VTRTGAAIEARELTKTYGGGVRALDGLGFTVEAGTVFGLLGPNGAGFHTPTPRPPSPASLTTHIPTSTSPHAPQPLRSPPPASGGVAASSSLLPRW